MKIKLLYTFLVISLLFNLIVITYTIHDKNRTKDISTITTEVEPTEIEPEDSNSSSRLNNIFMDNVIDQYFMDKLNNSKSEIDYEITQNAYMKAWKEEYEKILNIIENKCIYPEDKEIYTKYNESIKEVYNNLESALVPIMLNNFKISPDNPSKNSFGQGTRDGLTMYQGMVYRNSCIIFIPYLTEYTFPTTDDLDIIVKEVTQES